MACSKPAQLYQMEMSHLYEDQICLTTAEINVFYLVFTYVDAYAHPHSEHTHA